MVRTSRSLPKDITSHLLSSSSYLLSCLKHPLDETVPLGVCLENDEYGAYRLDVVDGFVSKGGDTNEQTPGLKIQYHFGCTKDENGECSECGHVGEVWPGIPFLLFPFLSFLYPNQLQQTCARGDAKSRAQKVGAIPSGGQDSTKSLIPTLRYLSI